MKKSLLILLAIIFAINLNTQAEDFSAVHNGDTIYYNITSSTSPRTVAVTYRGASSSSYSNEYSGAVSIPDSVLFNNNYYKVTSIGDRAFWYCYSLSSITIPNSVTSIGYNAFYRCTSLTSITIPNSVTSIGDYAFENCSGLTSITIPNSVTSIGNNAFENCTGLTSITIPNSVTSIGNGAFYRCSGLTSVTIPNSVPSIGYRAFDGCTGLTSITIGNSVTSIGGDAFAGCSGLTSITIPNSVTSIGGSAFWGCSGLTSITIGNSVTLIEPSTFSECSGLTSITIPNSVTSIGGGAFYACTNLDTVYFNANNCTTMGTYASNVFFGCFNFRTLIIGDSVQNIPSYAFYNCNSLTSITSKAINPPAVQGNSFSGVSKTIPFYVPCNSIPSYNSAMYWSEFTNKIGVRMPQFITSSICDGSIYTNYGANIDSAGVYTLVNGCDSIILNLILNPTYQTNHYDTICKGQTYNNYGFNFIADTIGLYTQNHNTINGCDSIIKLYLIVNSTPNPPSNLTINQISNFFEITWQSNGISYEIYRDDSLIANVTQPIYLDYDLIHEQPYCYKVKSINGDCESELSNINCKTYLNIENIEQPYISTKLYPNPTNNKSRLEVEGLDSDADVFVYDMVGRVIQKHRLN
ncbi:MAG: leucine-rich repeat domain-containing protein, partial [Bacteroidia bacterium]|nr:leucine-rich repeat domain-containing protein [Bacteroidia bacterium]